MPLGEFALIERYFARRPGRDDVVLGVGDDAAVLQLPGDMQLVAALDTLVEGRHFLPGIAARSVGHQALAVNLSDLAAMGALPAWALLSLSLPESDERWLQSFSDGLYAIAGQHGVELVGGDTVQGPRVVSVTLLGQVETGTAIRRSGARTGDLLFVSGQPGEAAGGLALLQAARADSSPALVQRQLFAQPRVSLGRALRGRASAAIDISDGLLGDLGKLCAASRVGACVDLERLPVSDALRQCFGTERAQRMVLAGGDDYELLFTVPPSRAQGLEQELAAHCSLTRIGEITQANGLRCRRAGVEFDCTEHGHDHFA